jgi:hypothetical protein
MSLRGIRWGLFSTLGDIDYSDNLALLSHTHKDIQEKITDCKHTDKIMVLHIRIKKTETMTLNVEVPAQYKVNDEQVRLAENITYLGSIITSEGDKKNIHSRLGKARRIF